MPFSDETSASLTAAQLANALNCGVVARDGDHKIVFANECLLDWLGYRDDELDGHSVEILFPEDLVEVVQADMRAADRGDLRARITVLRRRNGSTFPVVLVGNPIEGDTGSRATFVSLAVDLATVHTARPATQPVGNDLGDTLARISNELQLLGLSAASLPQQPVRLDRPELRDLTAREKEVLVELVAGHRVPAIAKRLFISAHTVRNHLKSIFRKVGVDSQVKLLEWLGEI